MRRKSTVDRNDDDFPPLQIGFFLLLDLPLFPLVLFPESCKSLDLERGENAN